MTMIAPQPTAPIGSLQLAGDPVQSDPLASAPAAPDMPMSPQPFNVQQVDTNLQHIGRIENAWDLPSLPDQVKLDLASQANADHKSIGDFLWGLASDFSDAINPLSSAPAGAAEASPTGLQVAPAPSVQPVTFDSDPNSLDNQLRKIWDGVAGEKAPKVVDAGAVIKVKQEAVRRGLLPAPTPDQPINAQWTPEMRTVQAQMLNQDFDKRIGGNRPGSVSIGTVAKGINDWLTPSGLLSAAVNLKILPDVADWTDRIGEFTKHPSAHSLFGALWGTVDDIVFPVVNDYLMATGVGEAYMFGRTALTGAEATEASAGLFGALRNNVVGRAVNLGRAYDAAAISADIGKFGESSFLAQKLQTAGGALGKAGDALEAWRQIPGVMSAKKAISVGMRLGVAGRIEDLIPGHKPGTTIGDIAQYAGINDLLKQPVVNPLAHGLVTALDTAFAPPTVFGEGVLSDNYNRAREMWTRKVINVTDNQRLTGSIARAALQHVVSQAALPDAPQDVKMLAERMQTAFAHEGPSAALEHFYGSQASAAEATSWMTAVAAVDSMSATKAAERLGGTASLYAKPDRWEQLRATFRNKSIAQLRQIDPEDGANYAAIRAFQEAGSAKQRNKLIERYMGEWAADPSPAKAWIDAHNQGRQAHWQELLQNLDPKVFEGVMADAFPHIGNHEQFVSAIHEIDQAEKSGVFANAELRHAPAFSKLGWSDVNGPLQLDPPGSAPRAIAGGLTQEGSSLFKQSPVFGDSLVNRMTPLDKYGNVRWTTPLASNVDPSKTRFTVALADTVTKQDALQLWHYGKFLMGKQDELGILKSPSLADKITKFASALTQRAADEGVALHDAKASDVNHWVDELVPGSSLSRTKAKQIAALQSWATQNGTDIAGLAPKVDADIAALSAHRVWKDSYKIGNDLAREPGESLLGSQLRMLHKRSNWMAAEIDTGSTPELSALGDALEQRGYKLVHGVQYLAPHDLAGLDGPFQATSKWTMRRMTLGNFVASQPQSAAIGALRQRSLKSEIAGALSLAHANGHLSGTGAKSITGALEPDSAEVAGLTDMLTKKVQELGDNAARAIESSYANQGVFGRTGIRIANAKVPVTVSDLSAKQIATVVDPIYGPEATAYVKNAVLAAKASESSWETNGLYHLEQKLRGQDNVASFLRVLGRTQIGDAWAGIKAGENGPASLLTGAMKEALKPSTLVGAVAGAGVAQAAGQNPLLGAAAGGVVGDLGGQAASRAITGKDYSRYYAILAHHPTWTQYTHIADGLAHMRDQLRFTLNPFFDLRRYVKGYVLGQTADVPKGVKLPGDISWSGVEKKFGMAKAGEIWSRFAGAARGDFNPDVLDSVDKFMAGEGILGYNPQRAMAALFGHLTDQGVDAEKAYGIAKKAYSYGTTGRSGLEKSINYIFFPFSFEKKLIASSARFLGNDLSRAAMLHDAMKSYEMLDDRYDLSKFWQDHVPMLHQLQKLNAFSHGLSPGELGGVNRPLIDFTLGLIGKEASHAPILNAFMPQGVSLGSQGQSESFMHLIERSLPVRNDMNNLLDDMKEQGHVLFAPSHLTTQAETERGWSEANQLKASVDKWALANGFSGGFDSVLRNPRLAPVKQFVEERRSEIAKKFPGWTASIDGAIQKNVATERELSFRLADIQAGKVQPGDAGLVAFNQFNDQAKAALSNVGIDMTTHPDFVPSGIFDSMRRVAVELAQQDPAFLALYRRYYSKAWGPIEMSI